MRRVALAALLLFGAAGLSGHLVGGDHCSSVVLFEIGAGEGTSYYGDTRWAPPGYECAFLAPSGTTAGRRFVYEDGWQRAGRTGSWIAFLGTPLAGFGIVGSALRGRPAVPAWLRLTAVTTIAFAVAGVGALLGGVKGSVLVAIAVGVLVAFASARRFGPGRGHQRAAEAAVALCAVLAATTGWLLGLGLAAYGLALVAVSAVGALPGRDAVRGETPRLRPSNAPPRNRT